MSIDLRGLSVKELETLIAKARQQQTRIAKRTPIATVRNKIHKFVKAEGYTLDEVLGASAAGSQRGTAKASKATGRVTKAAKGSKVAPKYRNPDKREETWSGRGRQPRWLAAQVAQGKAAEEFLIRKK